MSEIKKFYNLLEKYEDDPVFVKEFSNFFRQVIQTNHLKESLPLVEMMAVLKYHRPTIAYFMKRNNNMVLNMLLEMNMGYKEAEEKLINILYKK